MENPASELGPQKYRWWPDWRGQACAIVACGPSLLTIDVASLRGRLRVIAIKEAAVEVCPWADVAYGCDWPWWRHREGLREFVGLKLGFDPRIMGAFNDVHRISIENRQCDQILTQEPLKVGSGGNSGFQALNLAIQFGANRILLAGFDMRIDQPLHWYGRNRWESANNPAPHNFKRWTRAFSESAHVLKKLGVDVVNASPMSALSCFQKASIADTLIRWAV